MIQSSETKARIKMKVERWEEESDEDWAERLVYETAIANNTETTLYMVHRDPYEEDGFIINYVGETSMTWKEHPEGPFTCKQVLEWKNKAEQLKYAETAIHLLTDEVVEIRDKLEAVEKTVDEWGEQRSDPHGLEYDWHYKDKYFALRDALDSEFTTNSEESE